MDQLFDAFFHFVYPSGAAFVRRSDLYRMVEEDGFHNPLVKAVCAVSYRFLDDADPDHLDGGSAPCAWAREAYIATSANPGRLSESKIATWVILRLHENNSGRHASGWMLLGMACRMAFAMKLNRELPASDGTEWVGRETRRRIVWCIHAADAQSCAGLPEYTLCPPGSIRCLLPASERNFSLGLPTQGRFLHELMPLLDPHPLDPSEDGLFSRMARLMVLRVEILKSVHRRVLRLTVQVYEASLRVSGQGLGSRFTFYRNPGTT